MQAGVRNLLFWWATWSLLDNTLTLSSWLPELAVLALLAIAHTVECCAARRRREIPIPSQQEDQDAADAV